MARALRTASETRAAPTAAPDRPGVTTDVAPVGWRRTPGPVVVLVVVLGAATVALAITLPTAAFTGAAAPLAGGTLAPGLRTPDDAPTVGVARPTEPLAEDDVDDDMDVDGDMLDGDALDGVEAGRVIDVVVGATATTGTDGVEPDVRTVSEPLSPFGVGVGVDVVDVATGVGVGLELATTGLTIGLYVGTGGGVVLTGTGPVPPAAEGPDDDPALDPPGAPVPAGDSDDESEEPIAAG